MKPVKRNKRHKPVSAEIRRKFGMAPSPLSLSPQYVTEDIWFYEERKGLKFIVWNEKIPGHTQTHQQFLVPWKSVATTMQRYRKYRPLKRSASMKDEGRTS